MKIKFVYDYCGNITDEVPFAAGEYDLSDEQGARMLALASGEFVPGREPCVSAEPVKAEPVKAEAPAKPAKK